jgi:hypothetical protein
MMVTPFGLEDIYEARQQLVQEGKAITIEELKLKLTGKRNPADH